MRLLLGNDCFSINVRTIIISIFCPSLCRQEKYVTLRDAIRDAMQNLELSARSSFEVELFISEPQTVTLTDDDMERIKVYILNIQTNLCNLIFYFSIRISIKAYFLAWNATRRKPKNYALTSKLFGSVSGSRPRFVIFTSWKIVVIPHLPSHP
jgi:hypothetical protein